MSKSWDLFSSRKTFLFKVCKYVVFLELNKCQKKTHKKTITKHLLWYSKQLDILKTLLRPIVILFLFALVFFPHLSQIRKNLTASTLYIFLYYVVPFSLSVFLNSLLSSLCPCFLVFILTLTPHTALFFIFLSTVSALLYWFPFSLSPGKMGKRVTSEFLSSAQDGECIFFYLYIDSLIMKNQRRVKV